MEQIYTIPVNEAFEASAADKSCGCPFCSLYNKLEDDELELILGASMMEPDVRIKTNEQGFCRLHYDLMFVRKNRLGMALTLESHLGELKKELKDVPVLKQVMQCTNSFAMDREDVRQSLTVIQAVIQEVKKGRNYLIFPEGTRSKTGNTMGEFHGGSFRCAVKAKCPIVPVAFVNSFAVLDQKGSKPLTVHISYLEPIPYEAYADLNTTELAALVKGRIQEEIDRILGQQTL